MNILGPDAVLVGQEPAHPDVGGELILRQADPAAPQILGRSDAGVRAHIDGSVAEFLGHEDRDCRVGRFAAAHLQHIGTEGHLGHVELAPEHPAQENLLRRQDVP
jgi:hypothetical protein